MRPASRRSRRPRPISKPVVYEHFGDKESLYAIVVDREMTLLMSMMTESLTSDRPRVLLEQAATALFDYIDAHTDGFRVLLRPHPRGDQRGGTFGTVMREVADHLTDRLVVVCTHYGYPVALAPMYAHMLVGMVALTGEWWAEVREPSKEAGHHAGRQHGVERRLGVGDGPRHGHPGAGMTPRSRRRRVRVTHPSRTPRRPAGTSARIAATRRRRQEPARTQPRLAATRRRRQSRRGPSRGSRRRCRPGDRRLVAGAPRPRRRPPGRAVTGQPAGAAPGPRPGPGLRDRHELAVWEFDVLVALRSTGPPYRLTPGQLLAETLVTSGTMTNRIDRLAERGLVVREPVADDRRGTWVALTDEGSASGRRRLQRPAGRGTRPAGRASRPGPGRTRGQPAPPAPAVRVPGRLTRPPRPPPPPPVRPPSLASSSRNSWRASGIPEGERHGPRSSSALQGLAELQPALLELGVLGRQGCVLAARAPAAARGRCARRPSDRAASRAQGLDPGHPRLDPAEVLASGVGRGSCQPGALAGRPCSATGSGPTADGCATPAVPANQRPALRWLAAAGTGRAAGCRRPRIAAPGTARLHVAGVATGRHRAARRGRRRCAPGSTGRG